MLCAAVAKVLGEGRQRFEQAMLDDGLSEQSICSATADAR
jgi:hypothetical protein